MKQSGDDASTERQQMLQREILSYLTQHPDAKDTVAGIMHWWLPGDRSVKESDISAALDGLVTKGWITVSSVGQGAKVYGLDRGRRDEIMGWLEN